jgi:hypothetical protein
MLFHKQFQWARGNLKFDQEKSAKLIIKWARGKLEMNQEKVPDRS